MSYKLAKYSDADLKRMPTALATEIRRMKSESDDFDADYYEIWAETDGILAGKAEAAMQASDNQQLRTSPKATSTKPTAPKATAPKPAPKVKAPKAAKMATKVANGTKAKYQGVFGDYDGDGILNVDDPNPTIKGDRETVEEVKLTDEIAALIVYREDMDDLRKEFVKLLEAKAQGEDSVYSRTKTPFSIVNKLRRKRLVAVVENGKLKQGPTGLTDIIGTMIVFSDQEELATFVVLVNKGTFGKVLEFDDYYKQPQAGYKAYHWNVIYKGTPVEIQAKTKRMYHIADENHTMYKTGEGRPEYLLALTDLMETADNGNKWAADIIDPIIADKAKLRHYLTKEKIKASRPGGTHSPIGKQVRTAPRKVARKATGTAKPQRTEYQSKVLAFRNKREALLARTLKREDLGRMKMEEVLEVAQEFNALRLDHVQGKDASSDSKQRLTPTAANLVRWMKAPGNFDMIGLDTYRRNDATANLKIREEIWWKRLGL